MWRARRCFCQFLENDKSDCCEVGDGCGITNEIFLLYGVKIGDHSVSQVLKWCNEKNDSSDNFSNYFWHRRRTVVYSE